MAKARILSEPRRVGIFGASGSGKTTKGLKLVSGLKRIIFFDPLDNLNNGRRFSDIEKMFDFIKKSYSSGFICRFVPELGKASGQLSEISKKLCDIQAAYKNKMLKTQQTLFVDELDVAFPLNITKKDQNNGFYYICCRGRHYGINIVGISQRMSLVDLPFRANLSDIFIFRLADFNDVKNAAVMLGNVYKTRIQALSNYSYIYKDQNGIITTNIIK